VQHQLTTQTVPWRSQTSAWLLVAYLGVLALLAQALLERRIEAAILELPEKGRAVARRTVERLDEAISSSEASGDPLPGWALFETGSGREPTKRRLRLGS